MDPTSTAPAEDLSANSDEETDDDSGILPLSHPKFLWIPSGTDLEVQDKEILPYEHVKILGHGASAIVEKVRDQVTGQVFAKKTFRNVYTRDVSETKNKFLNEVRIMRRLAEHHHVVKLHATYIVGRELALILDPVADGGDLATFLQTYRDLFPQGYNHHTHTQQMKRMTATLTRARGCLAAGLAFIHQQTIRHKDIKPQNILIHRGKVVYTDFGISRDFSDQGRSTTTGRPDSFTQRYCAPEVALHGNRNSKSDVFSLGCVFVEIYATLSPYLIHHSALDAPFYIKIQEEGWPAFGLWQTYLDMLKWETGDRPTAAELLAKFQKIQRECWVVLPYFCGKCLRGME